MEIQQLKYFIAVAEEKSFSKAAERYSVTQSAVSQQIKLLEGELGHRLFKRNAHLTCPTPAGTKVLPFARKVVRNMEQCAQAMAEYKEQQEQAE